MKLTVGRTCYVTFGRFQPPTVGHGASMDAIASAAKEGGGDYRIYVSQTNKPVKENPIPPDVKANILRKGFPKHADNIYSSSKYNVIPAALEDVMLAGYRNCVYTVSYTHLTLPTIYSV